MGGIVAVHAEGLWSGGTMDVTRLASKKARATGLTLGRPRSAKGRAYFEPGANSWKMCQIMFIESVSNPLIVRGEGVCLRRSASSRCLQTLASWSARVASEGTDPEPDECRSRLGRRRSLRRRPARRFPSAVEATTEVEVDQVSPARRHRIICLYAGEPGKLGCRDIVIILLPAHLQAAEQTKACLTPETSSGTTDHLYISTSTYDERSRWSSNSVRETGCLQAAALFCVPDVGGLWWLAFGDEGVCTRTLLRQAHTRARGLLREVWEALEAGGPVSTGGRSG